MAIKKILLHQRVLFKLMVPVVIIGIIFSALLVAYLSSPIKDFLTRQFDASLRLASVTGLQICEESFNYVLDLRLENNLEMNQVLINEAMEKIKSASQQFPHIHLMVVESGRDIKACSMGTVPQKWEGPSLEGINDASLLFRFGGKAVRSHVQFFPFWDWHIIGFVFDEDYQSPVRMAYTATYMSSAGVFVVMLVTLMLVFYFFINRPLNRLVASTHDISEGRFPRIERIIDDEFGQLMTAFNEMVASLENEKAAVGSLIHQLKESEALFRSQFEFGNIGIAITSVDRGWIRANERLCRMLGYSEKELLLKNWPEMTHPEDLEADMARFNRMVSGEIEGYEMEKRFFHKSGGLVFVHLNVSCFRLPDQSIKFIIASLLDITDRKRAEKEKEKLDAQLLQAQKMEAIGTLAGGVAHDFNNMLTVILGYAQAGLNEADLSGPLRYKFQQIFNAATRSADITRQLLAFARRQTIAPKIIDLNLTMEGMLNILRRLIGENIDLSWKPAENLWPVKMDPSQIDQILANLCVNARDAISGVGHLTIETGMVSFDRAYCEDHTGFIPGDFVLLAVSDDGCGMEKETLENLFEPFFTTKGIGKGTGLGLSMVYGIVKQNSGFINVYSEPGQGTTFKIYLPRHLSQEDPAEVFSSKESIVSGNETILLVEDEPMILELTKEMLELMGYRILSADRPSEAIRMAGEHRGEIHLLMTDIVMPEMNGRDLAGKLVSLYPKIKFLYMSGYTANVIAHQGVLDQGVAFIQKPFSMEDLSERIRKVLDDTA